MRKEDESPNDRNDRGTSSLHRRNSLPDRFLGIRRASAWYKAHLSANNPPSRGQPQPKLPTIVLLTEDAANRQKAEKEGIVSLSGEPSLVQGTLAQESLQLALLT